MSRKFEQEYSRANDRIHPRKELLQELEAKWAAEEAREAEEARKVSAFPTWARFTCAAAGILLCVGLGMGSMLLFSRSRGFEKKAAAVPQVAEGQAEEEAKILLEPAADLTFAMDMGAPEEMAEAETADAAVPMLMSTSMPNATAAPALPQGMHPAADEAEVEFAVRCGAQERSVNNEMPVKAAKKAQTAYPAGDILQRDGLIALFQPTTERVHVIRAESNKVSSVFSLTLKEPGAQVRRFFWLGDEFLAVQAQEGETELQRFGVASWKAPQHRRGLTQSGAFLAAEEMGGRVVTLSLYRASDQEPLPWVDGARLDYDAVLLDEERPCDVFTLLTVYDPAQEGFLFQQALLAESAGVAFGHEKVLLWTAEGALYVLSCDEAGVSLLAEGTLTETILTAAERGEGFSLLLQKGDDLLWLTLDEQLNETERAIAPGAGAVRWYEIYEEGAVFLTEDALHYLTAAGDRSVAVTGDGFTWLTPDRGLVLSASGQIQIVTVTQKGLEAQGTAQMKEDLAPLMEDLNRVAFDMGTGRLVIPAGKSVYLFHVDEAGKISPRSSPLTYHDHDETDQRELRCLLLEDRALVFSKSIVTLCNQNLIRITGCEY